MHAVYGKIIASEHIFFFEKLNFSYLSYNALIFQARN